MELQCFAIGMNGYEVNAMNSRFRPPHHSLAKDIFAVSSIIFIVMLVLIVVTGPILLPLIDIPSKAVETSIEKVPTQNQE